MSFLRTMKTEATSHDTGMGVELRRMTMTHRMKPFLVPSAVEESTRDAAEAQRQQMTIQYYLFVHGIYVDYINTPMTMKSINIYKALT
ncbi:hypothetical protein MAR_017995 [Mya arenaria]|uniref:Uncharacterized protein n=1 Tax=Mya arenaria TaxID=6604 RepID=A0ABY7EGQ0_MYAAR|nr:hypothetical protein MAR_017995 [Mya arenaria]